MALSNTTNRVETAALSGVVGGNIVATFNSRISTDTDLKVYEVTTSATTLLTLNSDYTLTKSLSGSLITGANVVATASAVAAGKFADGSVIVVIRETDYQQSSNYEPNAIIPADTLENDLDKLAMQTQQLKDNAKRAIQFSSTLPDNETPEPIITLTAAERANKILGFNADGSEFAVTQEIGNYRSNWVTGTVYSVRDIVKQASASDASTLNNIYICNTSHSASGSYLTQFDTAKWDLIVDAAAAAASASAAADDAADAEKLAINDEDIEYTLSDGVTTGYSALHYNAKAQAAKTDAVTAQGLAESAQAAAEGALTTIQGFYLGAQGSNPSVDGNGVAVTAGDWYFNTGDNTTRIYNGSSWDVIEALPQSLGTTDSPTFATVNATTVDSTNLEVTNIKAKDGTSAGSIADGTGVVTLASSVLTTADINGGTIDGTDITVGSGKTLNVSDGTLTLANDQINGNAINGGTISNFRSTGIDDNAASTALTIDASGNVQLANSLTAGTLGSGVVFPANHPLQIKSFNTNTDITVSASSANGTARILNDGSNNVAVTLTTSKANSSFMLIFGGSVGMEIDASGDYYGSAAIGFICNRAFTEGGTSRTANTMYNAGILNAWNNSGTTTSIQYSAYRSLNTNDRIIPFFNPTYIKHITTSISSGTSITFSMTGGYYNNTQVKVRNAYITVIEF